MAAGSFFGFAERIMMRYLIVILLVFGLASAFGAKLPVQPIQKNDPENCRIIVPGEINPFTDPGCGGYFFQNGYLTWNCTVNVGVQCPSGTQNPDVE